MEPRSVSSRCRFPSHFYSVTARVGCKRIRHESCHLQPWFCNLKHHASLVDSGSSMKYGGTRRNLKDLIIGSSTCALAGLICYIYTPLSNLRHGQGARGWTLVRPHPPWFCRTYKRSLSILFSSWNFAQSRMGQGQGS